jgi:hypothetical protein
MTSQATALVILGAEVCAGQLVPLWAMCLFAVDGGYALASHDVLVAGDGL